MFRNFYLRINFSKNSYCISLINYFNKRMRRRVKRNKFGLEQNLWNKSNFKIYNNLDELSNWFLFFKKVSSKHNSLRIIFVKFEQLTQKVNFQICLESTLSIKLTLPIFRERLKEQAGMPPRWKIFVIIFSYVHILISNLFFFGSKWGFYV